MKDFIANKCVFDGCSSQWPGVAEMDEMQMPWAMSHRFDRRALPLADRHYNRQHVGSPQFVPPGRCMVLLTPERDALWVTSWPFAEYTKHRWAGAWVNSLFRKEGGEALASDLIRSAVSATRWYFGDPPELGMITFIDRSQVKTKKNPGFCYLKAGFLPDGKTKGGLHAVRLKPDAMPPARQPMGSNLRLF